MRAIFVTAVLLALACGGAGTYDGRCDFATELNLYRCRDNQIEVCVQMETSKAEWYVKQDCAQAPPSGTLYHTSCFTSVDGTTGGCH